jgi:lipoate-protein ligase A
VLFHKLHFLIDPEPRNPAWNMAADEALATTGSLPMLRVYRWKVPAVSFGYFGVYKEVTTRWPGREPVRRWTGGGEVPHGEDFTYALAASRNDSLAQRSVGESYRMVPRGSRPLHSRR